MTNNTYANAIKCANCDHFMIDADYIVTIEVFDEKLMMHRGCAIADGFIDA